MVVLDKIGWMSVIVQNRYGDFGQISKTSNLKFMIFKHVQISKPLFEIKKKMNT